MKVIAAVLSATAMFAVISVIVGSWVILVMTLHQPDKLIINTFVTIGSFAGAGIVLALLARKAAPFIDDFWILLVGAGGMVVLLLPLLSPIIDSFLKP